MWLISELGCVHYSRVIETMWRVLKGHQWYLIHFQRSAALQCFFPFRLMSKTRPGRIKWKHKFFFRWNVEKDWFLKLLEMHVCLFLFCFLSYFQIIYSLFVYQKKIKFFPQEEFVLLLAGGHLHIKVNCQTQKKILKAC